MKGCGERRVEEYMLVMKKRLVKESTRGERVVMRRWWWSKVVMRRWWCRKRKRLDSVDGRINGVESDMGNTVQQAVVVYRNINTKPTVVFLNRIEQSRRICVV